MTGSVGAALRTLRHPVPLRRCAPAAGVAAGAVVALRLSVELRPETVADTVHVTALLLAFTTVAAVADPAGAIADAGPVPRRPRLLARLAPLLAVVAVGWIAALEAAPVGLRPPAGPLTAELVALCALVLTGAVVEDRTRTRRGDPLGAAAGVAMGWTGLWLIRPSWSPFFAVPAGVARPLLLALVAGAALLAATRDLGHWALPVSPAGRARWR